MNVIASVIPVLGEKELDGLEKRRKKQNQHWLFKRNPLAYFKPYW